MLVWIQFYDSSFSIQPTIENIDITENGDNQLTPIVTKPNAPIKMEYNGDDINSEVIYKH